MLVDGNILLCAVDRQSPQFKPAATWWTEVCNGDRRGGLPRQTLGAFQRIVTHPRVARHPLTGSQAWAFVQDWLAAPPGLDSPATEGTAGVLARLLDDRPGATGNLVPDAQLAALAIEHGLTVMTADTDFALSARSGGTTRWADPPRKRERRSSRSSTQGESCRQHVLHQAR